jgi:nucleoside-diphosphate-sugar epimerase
VFISTVAVYGDGPKNMVSESEKPNPSGPYAVSKLKAEEYLINWCRQKHISLLILRLPLIAGPNPPGNLGKMIKALKSKRYLRIGGGKAKRSIVSATDVALFISQNYLTNGIYNLTDQEDPSFKEIESYICNKLGIKEPWNLNIYLAKFLGTIGNLYSKSPINTLVIAKMTDSITFSSSKASKNLNWRPNSALEAIKPQ